MLRDWESQFATWAKSPSDSETQRCENTIKAIRGAIAKSEKLKRRKIKVFAQGSYRNRVNVRRDSDVDIGVMCHDVFLAQYPPGKTRADFGNIEASYSFSQFKSELEEALVARFGSAGVHRGNKAFDIHENSYRVDADVVPLFEYRRYNENGTHIYGVALIPDSGSRIYNYPERLMDAWPKLDLHYENAVSKNKATARAYKGVVRILKSLRNEMEATGIAAAAPIPGFLIECLVWNAPDECFKHKTWDEVVRAVLLYVWSNTKGDGTCKDWLEVNGIKYLFHSSQKWTRAQAHTFVDAAWSYVGVR